MNIAKWKSLNVNVIYWTDFDFASMFDVTYADMVSLAIIIGSMIILIGIYFPLV